MLRMNRETRLQGSDTLIVVDRSKRRRNIIIAAVEAGGPLAASPAVSGGKLVIGSLDGKLFCLG